MRVGFSRNCGTVTGLIVLIVITAASLPATAFAQGVDQSLVNRLDRMERELRTLNRQVYTGKTPPASAGITPLTPTTPGAGPVAGAEQLGSSAYAARTASRMSQMESELRAMTGTLETITHNLDQISGRLDRLVADVDTRLSALEGRAQVGGLPSTQGSALNATPGTGAATRSQSRVSSVPRPAGVQQVGPTTGGPVFGSGPRTLGTISGSDIDGSGAPKAAQPAAQPAQRAALAPAPQPVAAPQAGLPKGTPLEQFDHAFKLLSQAEYEKAGAAFQEFVETHPNDPLLSNANYWLGRTYYVRADYASAAKIFLDNYRKLPKGTKAPDSLANLGMSLVRLEKRKDACTTFNKFASEFPNADAKLKSRVSRERKQAECGS